MKTGSTAFQRAVEYATPKLIKLGCLPTVVPGTDILLQRGAVKEQKKVIKRLSERAASLGCNTLLFSSEHLSAIHETSTLQWLGLLAETGASIKAVLVRRPLRELYPSLYLQNLKGPRQRVSSFSEFVKEQTELDESHCWTRDCTSFNYPCLEKRMANVGVEVEQLQYSRGTLVGELLARVLPGTNVEAQELIPPESWVAKWRAEMSARGDVDSSRTLSWNVVPVAIEINRLARERVLDSDQRNRLLAGLLNASSLDSQLPEAERHHLHSIDALDFRINGVPS